MLENNDLTSSAPRVLIYPAKISKVSGRQAYFLFSLRQVEDILIEASVLPVPFSPSYVDGVTEWRNCIMPVVSLDAFWSTRSPISRKGQRLMVVRVPHKNQSSVNPQRMMLRITPPVRMLTLPIESNPVSPNGINAKIPTKGVYDWENRFLVVADLEKILMGSNNIGYE